MFRREHKGYSDHLSKEINVSVNHRPSQQKPEIEVG